MAKPLIRKGITITWQDKWDTDNKGRSAKGAHRLFNTGKTRK